MTIILGIDAAWTATQPSGVALVSSTDGNRRLIFAGSSYRHFLDHADEGLISTSVRLGRRGRGSPCRSRENRRRSCRPCCRGYAPFFRADHRAASFGQSGFGRLWRPPLQHAYPDCDQARQDQ